MKLIYAAILVTSLSIVLTGCKSTPKTDASDTGTSRASETVLEHIGNDAKTVGRGTLDAVESGLDAIGRAGHDVVDTFKSDKDE